MADQTRALEHRIAMYHSKVKDHVNLDTTEKGEQGMPLLKILTGYVVNDGEMIKDFMKEATACMNNRFRQ